MKTPARRGAPTTVDVRKRLAPWLDCTRCGLCKTRRKVVLGRGTAPADLLFIGEAPGKSEDLVGEAFVGRAGRILDAAIEDATRLSRRSAPPSYYITNTVGCIPRDDKDGPFREPTDAETLACWERVALTARLVNPQQVILLGNVAAASVGPRFPEAVRLRHPAYILRQGGTESSEYRIFVRELSDVFREQPPPTLGPKDVFGDRIHG